MKYASVLKRAWAIVWRYRALWIFGTLLALTTVNGFYFGYHGHRDEIGRGTPIKVTEGFTIYLPGEGPAIDLTDPQGFSIHLDGRELHELEALFTEVIPRWIWAVVIAAAIVLAGLLLVGTVVRYVAEAALIRMVNATEESGERLSVGQGFRLGWSRSAWRLFLIDLVIHLPVRLVLAALSLLALSPLLLWVSGNAAAGVVGTMFTAILFFLVVVLAIVANAALSLLIHSIRRACAIEGLGVLASIRRGLAVAKAHLKQVVVVWLMWIGVRLAWMALAVPAMILIFPVILLFIVAGAVLGGLPAVTVGALLSPFLGDVAPWIVGAIVGLPIFILVMSAPMLFLSGLVEVLKSGTWTLAYRDLRALESAAPQTLPELGTASLEAAQASA
jgi:hypothetical protein